MREQPRAYESRGARMPYPSSSRLSSALIRLSTTPKFMTPCFFLSRVFFWVDGRSDTVRILSISSRRSRRSQHQGRGCDSETGLGRSEVGRGGSYMGLSLTSDMNSPSVLPKNSQNFGASHSCPAASLICASILKVAPPRTVALGRWHEKHSSASRVVIAKL